MLLTLSTALLMAIQSGPPPRRSPARPQQHFTVQELARQGYRRLTGVTLRRLLVGKSIFYLDDPRVNAPTPSEQFISDSRMVWRSDIWEVDISYYFTNDGYCKNKQECYSVFRKNRTVFLTAVTKEGISRPQKVIVR